MIKKILLTLILILILINSFTYATEDVISSQMKTLNLSSFIKEAQNYTKDVFPNIDLAKFFSFTLKGKIDNTNIFKNILSLFGDEFISAISLIGSILIIIIVHSLLKNFTDNLHNKEGISQIAYYVQYILIVTLIMSNFSNIIKMVNESISNLVGFVNSLVPILLALMTATRKCCICSFNSTYNYFSNYNYRKYDNFINFTNNTNCNSYRNNF